MTGRLIDRPGVAVVLAAFGTRLAGVIVTTLTGLNPYAQSDADRFAARAAEFAATFATGSLPDVVLGPNRIVTLWGLVLSPVWLVPGPSRLYARLATAVLGALAVYLLYCLARTLHSPQAGVVAALPVVVYPSYVFVHSTVLREAFVLAGLVGATYLLASDPTWVPSARVRYALAAAAVAVVTVVRWENLPLYAVTVGAGLLVAYRTAIPRPRAALAVTVVGGLAGAWVARPLVRSAVAFLATKRRKRSEGRTVYFPEFVPDTVPKAVAFAPVGAVYFLFTPFPWMVETVADAVVLVEAVGNLVAAGAAVPGAVALWRRSEVVTGALVAGLLAAVTLYGLANANVGTNVRQRQMFLWILFLFAGVAVADRVDGDRWPAWLR